VGGKGLAGGYAPIGGVFATDAVMAPIAAAGDSVMFFTYGAQDVACAVADAVLRTVDEEDLVTRADVAGAELRARLEKRLGDHQHVGSVRGLGLMVGVELVLDRDGPVHFPIEDQFHRTVMSEALRRDVWIYPSSSGPAGPDAVMFGPAFNVIDDELDTMVDVLADSIDAAVSARA
jgi:adenosylmethionine-8-amino-7-oxononanoate aminotransferase